MISISFDAMGGDNAPYEIVKGALVASRELKIKSLIVGEETIVTNILKELGANLEKDTVEIVPSKSVIEMDEKNPAKAIKQKKDSSLVISNKLVTEGKASAVISAGNTGAATAASLFEFKRIPNFERPCICTLIPTIGKKMLLLDAGSNIATTPDQMLQVAKLGSFLASALFENDSPRVGLLNIGEEDGKGTELYKESFDLIKAESEINFVGNVEGNTIIHNICEVAVCDGFTGNIHLKALEGGLRMMADSFKNELSSCLFGKAAGLVLKAKGAFKKIKGHFDPSSYGGALLGGLNEISIISHGSSNAEAIKNAAKHAKLLVEADIIKKLKKNFKGNTKKTAVN
ncbi:MAG: phosphate acyltransferase PlsX [Candidatus Caenarcaniphilales bacterium]|nr:phosphate acyltransferase PlsX [Candidatus Caenarcaniphilales bacterium]